MSFDLSSRCLKPGTRQAQGPALKKEKKNKEKKMEKKVISTDKAPAAIGPYSQGIICGSFVFVSGQLGMIPETGEFAGDNLKDQAKQAISNMENILKAAGAGLENVVAVDVFLTDMGKFAEFNEIYEKFFSDNKPARAAIEVSALPRGGLVEVKCIAAI